jgi:hypothetical protein
MVTLKNEIKATNLIPLRELDDGVFFEFLDKIYQKLAWDDNDRCYNCLYPSEMTYVGLAYDKLVRPVDVEITVTGYTKKG